jgi:hypothetical protein
MVLYMFRKRNKIQYLTLLTIGRAAGARLFNVPRVCVGRIINEKFN